MDKTTENINDLIINGKDWTKRLVELATIDYDDINVSMHSLKTASHIVSDIEDLKWNRPGIFVAYTEGEKEDGISLEWAEMEPFFHLEIEISADGKTFNVFSMDNPTDENESYDEAFTDYAEMFAYISKRLKPLNAQVM